MFIGTNYPKLDDKFRLILPAKFRDRLAGGVIITKGQENCLVLLTKADYERRAEALMGDMEIGDADWRNFNRQFLFNSFEQTPDGQGRILLPQNLRDWASLERDLVVAGAGRHIEIWNPAAFETYMAAGAEAFANYNEREVRRNN